MGTLDTLIKVNIGELRTQIETSDEEETDTDTSDEEETEIEASGIQHSEEVVEEKEQEKKEDCSEIKDDGGNELEHENKGREQEQTPFIIDREEVNESNDQEGANEIFSKYFCCFCSFFNCFGYVNTHQSE